MDGSPLTILFVEDNAHHAELMMRSFDIDPMVVDGLGFHDWSWSQDPSQTRAPGSAVS